ncbi:hypothetical protein BJ508DRAFT_36500 [Ascobolus immersus RN42]|uniref:CRCB-domain-containing protein n=1 Tax=Ascobolus immersus RN42 TaxID=1160509 RepID=A0A3N4IJI2_ASCIM|nr:hypothetical protein BJ508DRAFT_36500 [Ascobolus immersus RN42]
MPLLPHDGSIPEGREGSDTVRSYYTATSDPENHQLAVPSEERGVSESTAPVVNPYHSVRAALSHPDPNTSESGLPTLPSSERGISEITAPVGSFTEVPTFNNQNNTEFPRPNLQDTQVPTDSLPPYHIPTVTSEPHVIDAGPDGKLPAPSIITTLIYLSLFAITGTATRLGLVLLTDYGNAPAPPLIWAQFAGCFIMGLCQSMLPVFTAKDAPIFIGLTTGYAGSVTSFSSFMLDAFSQTSYTHYLPPGGQRRGGGQGALALPGYIIVTLCTSFGGLRLGRNIGRWIHAKVGIEKISTVVLRGLDWLACILCMAVFPIALFLGIFKSGTNQRFLWGMVFSPPGAIARYSLSRLLNPRLRGFPLGTFVVNMLGTGVLAGAIVGRLVLERRGLGDGDLGGLVWLGALQDGFCGCLTTVSTFVVEAEGLGGKGSLRYVGSSVILGLCLMVAIIGGYVWSLD